MIKVSTIKARLDFLWRHVRARRHVTTIVMLALLLAPPAIVGAKQAQAQSHVPTVATEVPRDLAQEERNRQTVLEFHDLAFNRHDFEKAGELLADGYIQHNPRVEDGRAGFIASFKRRIEAAGGNLQTASRLLRSGAERDLVWLHTHVTEGAGDRGFAVMDIFRVDNGVIVEHWDVIQPVPETAVNGNTMF